MAVHADLIGRERELAVLGRAVGRAREGRGGVFLVGGEVARAKVLDFGIARQLHATRAMTMTGQVVGTIGYMAPEQVRGAAADHRTDIFAFGCVLYEMCTGARAFAGPTPADTMAAVLSNEPPELKMSGSPPPALDRIVRRCLEKQPVMRFQSARDLSFALDALSTSSTPAAVLCGAAIDSVAARVLKNALVAAADASSSCGRAFTPSSPR